MVIENIQKSKFSTKFEFYPWDLHFPRGNDHFPRLEAWEWGVQAWNCNFPRGNAISRVGMPIPAWELQFPTPSGVGSRSLC